MNKSWFSMNGMNELLEKLSVEDVEKLRILFSINSDQQSSKCVITLRLFCDEYEEFIKSSLSSSYYESVVSSFIHLKEYFGLQKPIDCISFKEFEKFMTFLQKKAPKGYRVYFRNIKAAFNKAKDWEYIKVNHCQKIKLAKVPKLNPAFITEDSLEKALSFIDLKIVRDVVTFAFYTGLRRGEIVNLQWKNIDLDKGIITVGDEEFTTKGKNQRYVPITYKVKHILLNLVEQKTKQDKNKIYNLESFGKYVFSRYNGYKYSGNFFSKKFKEACKKADIDKSIHFHSLRHSFASSLVQKGKSLYVIKELLGHSSISTTEIYSHLNMDSLREAVDSLNGDDSLMPAKAVVKAKKVSGGLRLVKI